MHGPSTEFLLVCSDFIKVFFLAKIFFSQKFSIFFESKRFSFSHFTVGFSHFHKITGFYVGQGRGLGFKKVWFFSQRKIWFSKKFQPTYFIIPTIPSTHILVRVWLSGHPLNIPSLLKRHKVTRKGFPEWNEPKNPWKSLTVLFMLTGRKYCGSGCLCVLCLFDPEKKLKCLGNVLIYFEVPRNLAWGPGRPDWK